MLMRGVGLRARMPPRGDVMAGRVEIRREPHLLPVGHRASSSSSSCPSRPGLAARPYRLAQLAPSVNHVLRQTSQQKTRRLASPRFCAGSGRAARAFGPVGRG